MNERIRVSATRSESGCPYCREVVGGADTTSECEGCKTRYHAACLEELGGCSTLGCRGAPTRGPAERARADASEQTLLVIGGLFAFVVLLGAAVALLAVWRPS